MHRLKDRVALITGGASGMGEASVRLFVSEGAHVVLADIDVKRGNSVADEFSDACVFIQCDHTKPAENEAAVAAAVKEFGKLDILFNNAGIPFANDSIENVDDEILQRIVDVDLIGPYRMTRAAMPALREERQT